MRSIRRQLSWNLLIVLLALLAVGDAVLYETIQDYLGSWDLVLYESVMPPGARGPRGDTDEECTASTTAAMGFVASVAWAHQQKAGKPAKSAASVKTNAPTTSPSSSERMRCWRYFPRHPLLQLLRRRVRV